MKLCRCLSVLVVVLVLVILLGFTGMVKADLNEGLKAYYPFNGNANDESLNSYHGEINGEIGYVEGKVGTAAEFDGSQDIQLPIKLDGITENQYLSIAFWGKSNSEDSIFITNANIGDWSNSVIFSTRHIGILGRGCGERDAETGGWCVGVEPVLISGDLIPRSCASMIRPTINDFGYSDVDYTEWHYYALTYNNDIERVYIDGMLVDEVGIGSDQVGGFNGHEENPRYDEDAGMSCSWACYDRSLNIGVQNNAFKYEASRLDGERLNGLIDEVRIYNRTLSESEVQELYREGEICEDRYDEGFESGKQYCIDNPEDCGIDIGENYQEGYDDGYQDGIAEVCTQDQLYEKYEEGKQYCINHPEECGIETDGDYQEGYEDGLKECDNSTSSNNNCATFDMFSNTLYMPCFNGGSKTYWIDWELSGSDPITLELKDLGEN